MENRDDSQLSELLREWKVETPGTLEERVLGARKPWWQFLVSGSIRVPVPVALCLIALMMAGVWRQSQLAYTAAACASTAPSVRQAPCPADAKC